MAATLFDVRAYRRVSGFLGPIAVFMMHAQNRRVLAFSDDHERRVRRLATAYAAVIIAYFSFGIGAIGYNRSIMADYDAKMRAGDPSVFSMPPPCFGPGVAAGTPCAQAIALAPPMAAILCGFAPLVLPLVLLVVNTVFTNKFAAGAEKELETRLQAAAGNTTRSSPSAAILILSAACSAALYFGLIIVSAIVD